MTKFSYSLETVFEDGSRSKIEHNDIIDGSDVSIQESRWQGQTFWNSIESVFGDNGPFVVDFCIGILQSRSAKVYEDLRRLLVLWDKHDLEESHDMPSFLKSALDNWEGETK